MIAVAAQQFLACPFPLAVVIACDKCRLGFRRAKTRQLKFHQPTTIPYSGASISELIILFLGDINQSASHWLQPRLGSLDFLRWGSVGRLSVREWFMAFRFEGRSGLFFW